MRLTYVVPPEAHRETLRSLLTHRLLLSAAQVTACREADAVRVDGGRLFLNQSVPNGALIEVDLPTPVFDGSVPIEHTPLNILYEDEALLALDKPAGALVHPSRAQYGGTLLSAVLGHLQATGQPLCAHPVHRLDRGTSGIVLFAKHPHAQARWIAAHAAGLVEKQYVGIALGEPPAPAGTIDLPILRVAPRLMRREPHPNGQAAETRYTVLSTRTVRGVPVSRLALTPVTGRTHQLRVHCLALGCPLLGDGLYHTPASLALSQALGLAAQLLHAARLAFPHPVTGAPLVLSSPMRRDEGLDD